jgi:predicted lipoprotein with Yx(FWY)xxD motif
MAIRDRNRVVLLMVAVGLSLGLAACGDDDEPTARETTPTTAAAPVATTAAPAVTTTAQAATGSTTALVKTADHATLGKIVVDGAGYTLYLWDRDTSSTSGCTGGCAGTWPAATVPAGTATPIPAEGVTGSLATSTHPDGATQLTLDGKPLYRYAADAAPGEAKGDGVGGTWHAVKVA